MNIDKLSMLFIFFITYSVIGWIIEVTCKSIENKHLVNRGFLIGPWCPIYGCGCTLIVLLLSKYSNDFPVLFVMSMIICSVLEYFTSFILEKLFKARWWDYSRWKFNINGRICLETMIPFGILGSLLVYYIQPFMLSIYNKIPTNTSHLIALILLIVFVADYIVSSNVMMKLKINKMDVNKDDTEEITSYVRNAISERSILYRRLINAYPNMKVLRNKIKSINNDIDNINQY